MIICICSISELQKHPAAFLRAFWESITFPIIHPWTPVVCAVQSLCGWTAFSVDSNLIYTALQWRCWKPFLSLIQQPGKVTCSVYRKESCMFRKAAFIVGFKCRWQVGTGINRRRSFVILRGCYLFKSMQCLSRWVRRAVMEWPAGCVTCHENCPGSLTLLVTFTARNRWNVDPFYNLCVWFFLKAVVGTIVLSTAVSRWQSSTRLLPWWGHTGTGSFGGTSAFPGCFIIPAIILNLLFCRVFSSGSVSCVGSPCDCPNSWLVW